MTNWKVVEGNFGFVRVERETLDVSESVKKEETAIGVTNILVAGVRLAGGTASYATSPHTRSELHLSRYWFEIAGVEAYFDLHRLREQELLPPPPLPREIAVASRAKAIVSTDGNGALRVSAIVLPDADAFFWPSTATAGLKALLSRYLRGLGWAAAGLAAMFVLGGLAWQFMAEDGANWYFLALLYATFMLLPVAMSCVMLKEDWPGAREAESLFKVIGLDRPGWVDLKKRWLRPVSWTTESSDLDFMCRLSD